MKLKLFAISISTLAFVSMPSLAASDHAVRDHVTKKGTYVPPSRATNPNQTQFDNYNSKPNINPATGKQGTRTPTK
jgi:hypothetical protein